MDVKRGTTRLLIALVGAYWLAAGLATYSAYQQTYSYQVAAKADWDSQPAPDPNDPFSGGIKPPPPPEPAISAAQKAALKSVEGWAVGFGALAGSVAATWWVLRGYGEQLKIPSVRATTIVASGVALIGLVNTGPSRSLLISITNGYIPIGGIELPYKWVLSTCIVIVFGRLLLARSDSAPKSQRPRGSD